MSDQLTVQQVLAGIRDHESGGNYTAQNPYGSASGAYQFIDSTWRSVLKMFAPNLAGRYARAKDAPAAVQDQVALAYASDVYRKTGDLRAIPSSWYVGGWDPGNLDYVPSPESGNKQSVRDFITDVFGRAAKQPKFPFGRDRSTAAGDVVADQTSTAIAAGWTDWLPWNAPGTIAEGLAKDLIDGLMPVVISGVFLVGGITLVVIGANRSVAPITEPIKEKIQTVAQTAATTAV